MCMVVVMFCSECVIVLLLVNSLYRFDMIDSVGVFGIVVSVLVLKVLFCLKWVMLVVLNVLISVWFLIMFCLLKLCSRIVLVCCLFWVSVFRL